MKVRLLKDKASGSPQTDGGEVRSVCDIDVVLYKHALSFLQASDATAWLQH